MNVWHVDVAKNAIDFNLKITIEKYIKERCDET